MSATVADDYTAKRTESMDQLATSLKTVFDCAVQVDADLHDASSRASQLDAMSDDVLDVMDNSSRLAALLDTLCARQPRYACFLWTAARNLVRDVIGHVTSIDLHPPVKGIEDVNELDDVNGRRRRRAAVEIDMFYGDDTHLAYADWLEAVSTNKDPSPNHDLCCRLLSHIPLLAAYTGWPTGHHGNSEAGTQPFQTKNVMHNGDAGVTERANEGVVKTDLESEGQGITWRPTEEDKKYIEEVVRSVVDREDLCRLLMIAMATELERPTSREGGDQSGTLKSPTHLVQFAADSPSEDFDHGDTAHDASNKFERPKSQELSRGESTKSAALEYLGEELMAESAGCDLEPAGDGDSVQTGTIVFDDATSDSLKSARSTAPSPVNTVSLSAENLPQDVTGELSAQDALWFGRESCKTEPGKSLDMELLDAIRATGSTTLIAEIRQGKASLSPHQQALNSTACRLYQTADNENTYGSSPVKSQTLVKTTQGADETQTTVNNSKSSLEFLLLQNLESLTVGSKHTSATTTKPANTRIEIPVRQLSETEVPLLMTSCAALSDDTNTHEFGTNGDVTVTKPRQLLNFHGEEEETRGDKHDHNDPLSLAECGLSPASLTEVVKERRSKRREVQVDDDCRVTFRPLQVPVTSPKGVNVCNAPSALRSYNAAYTRTPGHSTGRDRKPRSSPHDVKCSQRRKSVAA